MNGIEYRNTCCVVRFRMKAAKTPDRLSRCIGAARYVEGQYFAFVYTENEKLIE